MKTINRRSLAAHTGYIQLSCFLMLFCSLSFSGCGSDDSKIEGTAPEGHTASNEQLQQNQSAVRNVKEAVEFLDPFVARAEDGTFIVNAPQGVLEKIHPSILAGIFATSRQVNALIREGKLISVPPHEIQFADKTIQTFAGGSSGFNIYWWGYELDLSERLTQKVEGVLAIGGGVGAILAALEAEGIITIPPAILTGILAGILGIGAGALVICNNGNGVKLYWVSLAGHGVPWCSAQ